MRGFFTALLALGVGAVLAAPTPAAAHAVLLETSPADGAVLDEAPDKIVLRFNEPVGPLRIQIIGPDGAPVAGIDDARTDNDAVVIALPETLDEGTHVVSYRVRSMDMHPVGGSLTFAIRAESAAAVPAETAQRDLAWQLADSSLRVIQVAALLIAAGGGLYLVLVGAGAPPGTTLRRGLLIAAATGILATALKGGAHGGLLLGATPGALLTPELWQVGFSGRQGASALVTAGGLALVAAGLIGAKGIARGAILLAGAALALAGFGFVGHSATTEPRWLMRVALYAHVVAVAFWAGSMMPLWLATRDGDPATAVPVVARFSRIAFGAVSLIVLAGLVMAWMLLTSPDDLAETTYGGLLAAKLVLVATLLTIAARNKLSLTPLLAMGDHRAQRALNRNIALEGAGMIVVVAVTVAMTQSVPPRAVADHHHHTAHEHDHEHQHDHHHLDAEPGIVERVSADGREAEISIAPGRAGRNVIRVQVEDDDGDPIEPIEVTIEIASEGWGIEPIRREMQDMGDGIYELAGNELSLAGVWELRIDVLVTEFEKPIFRVEIEVE